jgi:hypothetical protein
MTLYSGERVAGVAGWHGPVEQAVEAGIRRHTTDGRPTSFSDLSSWTPQRMLHLPS